MTAASYNGTGQRTTDSITPAAGSAVAQSFLWNDATQIPRLLLDSANAYVYAAGNTPAEQVNLSSGKVSYLTADSLGSVRGIVSSTGSLTATTSYDAWGNPEGSGGLTSYTPFGYAGGYTDGTGLVYLINRYYDPQTGQFLSVDPDVNETHDPYGYTAGNPVSNTDPTGLCPCIGGPGGSPPPPPNPPSPTPAPPAPQPEYVPEPGTGHATMNRVEYRRTYHDYNSISYDVAVPGQGEGDGWGNGESYSWWETIKSWWDRCPLGMCGPTTAAERKDIERIMRGLSKFAHIDKFNDSMGQRIKDAEEYADAVAEAGEVAEVLRDRLIP
jgi:RHS repeat-associated protein